MTKHAAILRDLDELGQMTFLKPQGGDFPQEIDELPRGMDALEKRTGLKYPTKRFAEYIDSDDIQWWMTYDYQRHRSSKVWYEPDDSGVYPDQFYRNGRVTTDVPEDVYEALCDAAYEQETSL